MPADEKFPPAGPTGKFHPELAIDGFTAIDGTVRFYSFVKAIMLRLDARHVLEFGAGRGALIHDRGSAWRRHLSDLRTTGAQVTACDIDPAVREHAASHQQVVIAPDASLPFLNGSFDVIVSDMTFEHLERPQDVASELLRVLKPGGYVCARTPNKFGYPKIVASIMPNRFHAGFLRRVQPGRMEKDVFPTFYRLNSRRDAIRHFPTCEVFAVYDMPEPAYYFGSRSIYGVLLALHRVLPRVLSTSLLLFIRKPESLSQ